MNDICQLIPIQADDNLVQTVSARDLHSWLDIGKDFSTWIKSRIDDYGFTEGTDFTTVKTFPQNGGKGRPAIEYHISLDMAKELSMVERNERGKQARQYFIASDKRRAVLEHKVPPQLPDFTNPVIAARAWADSEEKRLLAERNVEIQRNLLADQEATIEVLQPEAEYAQRIMDSGRLIATNVIAKQLGMSAVTLNRNLKAAGVQYRCNGVWVLTCKYQDKGYAQIVTHTITRSDGKLDTAKHMKWTERGQRFILDLISVQNVNANHAGR